MSEGKVVAEKNGYLGRLIISNPSKHNAVSKAMWHELANGVKAYDIDDDVRVIVLEGAGEKAFAAGADISKFENERGNLDQTNDYSIAVGRGYSAVQHSLKPTIAKIRGYCYGGGMGIAVSCDLRICSSDSSFCIPAAKLGIGYGHENTKVLIDLVGPSFAKEIFYTGRRFDAEEARAMSFINRVLPRADLDTYVQEYVDMIVGNAPLSLRATNLIVNELLKDESDRDISLCEQLVDDCAKSKDVIEGRTAFMEKRKPIFRGR